MGLADKILIGEANPDGPNFDTISVAEKSDLPHAEDVNKPTLARIEAADDYGLVFDS